VWSLGSFILASGEVPITVARAAPSAAADHFAESRSRFPAVCQCFCTSASGEGDEAASSSDLAGHAGQMTRSFVRASQPSCSDVLPHWFQGAPLRQTLRVITCPAGATSTFHSTRSFSLRFSQCLLQFSPSGMLSL
jgi:hypothetical protein